MNKRKWAQEFAFVAGSQAMLRLLVLKPHFEKHCSESFSILMIPTPKSLNLGGVCVGMCVCVSPKNNLLIDWIYWFITSLSGSPDSFNRFLRLTINVTIQHYLQCISALPSFPVRHFLHASHNSQPPPPLFLSKEMFSIPLYNILNFTMPQRTSLLYRFLGSGPSGCLPLLNYHCTKSLYHLILLFNNF